MRQAGGAEGGLDGQPSENIQVFKAGLISRKLSFPKSTVEFVCGKLFTEASLIEQTIGQLPFKWVILLSISLILYCVKLHYCQIEFYENHHPRRIWIIQLCKLNCGNVCFYLIRISIPREFVFFNYSQIQRAKCPISGHKTFLK